VAALKQGQVRPRPIRSLCSPRRRRRGRIEAKNVPRPPSAANQVLHGVAAVAALKRRNRGRGGTADRVLHGVAAVAALKHGPSPPLVHPGPVFSTASPPWPH